MQFIKLSLATCVALCGLGNVANAQPLEEAIKGVDVSGMLRYRYTDDRYKNQEFERDNNGNGSANHQWRAEALFKTPVINSVSLNLGIRYHNAQQNVNHGKGNPPNSANSSLGQGLGSGKDSSFGVGEFNVVITPESTATTIKAGKMLLPTPLNDTLDDRGTGILVTNADLNHWNFVVGAFDAWSLDDQWAGYALVPNYTSMAEPLYTAAVLGNYPVGSGSVEAQLWLFKIKDILNVGAFTQLGYSNALFHIVGQYAFADLETEKGQYFAGKEADGDLYTLDAGVKLHDFNVPLAFRLGYIGNTKDSYAVSLDDEGSFNKLGAIWYSTSTSTGVGLSTLTAPEDGTSKELSVIYAGVSYDVLSNLSIGLDYVRGSNTIKTAVGARDKREFREITPNVAWQFSKQLEISSYYAFLKTDRKDFTPTAIQTDSEDLNEFRVEVKYSF